MVSPGLFVIAAFCALPLVTLAHELGHAWAALTYSEGPVEVYVGRTDCALKLRRGRLRLFISPVGTGGLCRSATKGLSRRQQLVRVLAGPGVNLVIVVIAGLIGAATSGGLSAVFLTVTGISALQLLNLIPRWGVWGPLRKGIPTDGLQALCLARGRPLPAPPSRRPRGSGLNDPVGWSQLAACAVAFAGGMLIAAHVIPVAAVYVFIGLTLQQTLNARAPKPKSVATPEGAEAMKTCPSCGAQILRSSRRCYCDHTFAPQPHPAPATRAAAGHSGRPAQPTTRLMRIALYGVLLVIATIGFVIAKNEITCGQHTCLASARAVAPGPQPRVIVVSPNSSEVVRATPPSSP